MKFSDLCIYEYFLLDNDTRYIYRKTETDAFTTVAVLVGANYEQYSRQLEQKICKEFLIDSKCTLVNLTISISKVDHTFKRLDVNQRFHYKSNEYQKIDPITINNDTFNAVQIRHLGKCLYFFEDNTIVD